MNDRRNGDRHYTFVVVAFLIGLVVLGLLGVPALLVAAIGGAVAAVAITVFHGLFEGGEGVGARRSVSRARVPERYVPSVLEGSSIRRRRIGFPKRDRHASPPLRLH
jgi:hypothetical protein